MRWTISSGRLESDCLPSMEASDSSYWDFNKEFLVSPRISIGFIPERNSRVAMRLAGGLYYQSPFYKEFRITQTDADGNSYQTLNSNIKSQRSIQLILGSDYTFRAMDRPFKLTAEAYYKNLANLIPYELDNLKLVYTGVNASKGFITGIDFKLFGQFVPGTDSWISFSLMKDAGGRSTARKCRALRTNAIASDCFSPTISQNSRS